jgi:hypothetical protein
MYSEQHTAFVETNVKGLADDSGEEGHPSRAGGTHTPAALKFGYFKLRLVTSPSTTATVTELV